MGTTHATADGTFEFTDSEEQQMPIPLSASRLVNGTLSVDASKWTWCANYSCGEGKHGGGEA